MYFRIADTFTDSLTRLSNDEQKAVKTTAFDLQLNPANPGMQFHKLSKTRDKNFWSVRVSADIRLIVHKTESSLLLCYVDHHDKAYDWAERRKLEIHPKTGAAQLVEIRETVKEVVVPKYVEEETPPPPQASVDLERLLASRARPLFAGISDDDLLRYGVPPDWIEDVRAATEDSLLTLADHLPDEASEALIELATGGKPRIPVPVPDSTDPFEHPDAQRRFRVMMNVEELERALDYPWEKWTIFLHPEQREWVERDYNGPARMSGSAGTGKTIVALHRAAYLARSHPDARVLLATFSDPLAHALQTQLRRLLASEPRLGERMDVYSMNAIGLRLYRAHVGPATIATDSDLRRVIEDAASRADGHKFSANFLLTEWNDVVDGWQLDSWDAYRNVVRLGRKTRLPESRREILWSIFERVREGLRQRNLTTPAAMFTRLATAIAEGNRTLFDFAVVDEAQDLSMAQLRFLAALGGGRSNALFFTGDLGQRIFQQPYSWKSLGVDIQGRCRTLRVNYRTSHQIRAQADRLLEPQVSDVDGNTEERGDTVSVFNGPQPAIRSFDAEDQEIAAVADWLAERTTDGVAPHEFGVFVRSGDQIDRARAAVEKAGMAFKILDEHVETTSGHASVSTMHLAKGLEFRAVVVMACDDEVIPLQSRIETVGDDADLKEIYDTERHLLYVACTRARDHLLITSVAPASEFLDDMGGGP